MPPKLLAVAAAALLTLARAAEAAGQGHAAPEEVVDKVRQAARYLAEAGGEGLARFRGAGSDFVWKDTYVFVSDCDKRTTVAHPTMPERDGKPIADGPIYGEVTAARRADAQCEAARKPGGGWFEYPFPKPGERQPSRKVTYMLAVPGIPYVVGAGVYDNTVTLGELEARSAAGGADRPSPERGRHGPGARARFTAAARPAGSPHPRRPAARARTSRALPARSRPASVPSRVPPPEGVSRCPTPMAWDSGTR